MPDTGDCCEEPRADVCSTDRYSDKQKIDLLLSALKHSRSQLKIFASKKSYKKMGSSELRNIAKSSIENIDYYLAPKLENF